MFRHSIIMISALLVVFVVVGVQAGKRAKYRAMGHEIYFKDKGEKRTHFFTAKLNSSNTKVVSEVSNDGAFTVEVDKTALPIVGCDQQSHMTVEMPGTKGAQARRQRMLFLELKKHAKQRLMGLFPLVIEIEPTEGTQWKELERTQDPYKQFSRFRKEQPNNYEILFEESRPCKLKARTANGRYVEDASR